MDNFVPPPPLSTFFLSTAAAAEGSIRLSKEKEIRKEEKEEKIVIILFVNLFRCEGGNIYGRRDHQSWYIRLSSCLLCVAGSFQHHQVVRSTITQNRTKREEKEKKKKKIFRFAEMSANDGTERDQAKRSRF